MDGDNVNDCRVTNIIPGRDIFTALWNKSAISFFRNVQKEKKIKKPELSLKSKKNLKGSKTQSIMN